VIALVKTFIFQFVVSLVATHSRHFVIAPLKWYRGEFVTVLVRTYLCHIFLYIHFLVNCLNAVSVNKYVYSNTVYCSDMTNSVIVPCGACRQFLVEVTETAFRQFTKKCIYLSLF
jgi:hypothetical protein